MANLRSDELVITPPRDQLVRDEPMRVPIVLRLATPCRVRSVFANFRGAEETKATYTTQTPGPKGQMTTQVRTAIECVEIVKREWLLAGSERRGFFGNLADSLATLFGGGRHERMTPGTYRYEVELTVPPDAPATHKGERSRVFYELKARVDIALGRDLRVHHSFSVMPLSQETVEAQPVRVCYPDDEGRGFWSSLLEPDVRIELALDADRAQRGETIRGSFRVETQKPLDVRQIRVRLVGHEKSEAHGHSDAHHYKGEPVTIDAPRVIAPSWSTEFSLPAEVEGPPTTKGKLFSIDWFVEVALEVPWAKDPTIRAPITLG